MSLNNILLVSPLLRQSQSLSKYAWKSGLYSKRYTSLSIRNLRQCRIYSTNTATKTVRYGSKTKGLLLAFTFPSIFKPLKKTRGDIASVDEAVIPKEVYIDDLKVTKKRVSIPLAALYEIWSIIRIWFRSWRLLITFTPFVVSYPFTYLSASFNSLWLRWLVFACEHSGPTLIKFGQWASTRRDLFSQEFCDLFSKLHRRTPPHTWYYTRKKLEKAFGKNWSHVLVRIDDKDTPLGSGCVAQVYKAYMPSEMVVNDDVLEEILAEIDDSASPDYLDSFEILGFSQFFQRFTPKDHENEDHRPALSFSKTKQKVPALSSVSQKAAAEDRKRQERKEHVHEQKPEVVLEEPEMTDMKVAEMDGLVPVAVKVLHPGIYRAVQRDLVILRCVAWVAELVFPRLRWLSVRDCVEEFAGIMQGQIDLRHEARCLERFYDNFEHIPYVRFPRPVRPFVKRNVLVETFEEGDPISDFLGGAYQEECCGGIGHKLADIGVDALLKMIFVDNFIHGDLHPGNIMVQNAQDHNHQDESKLTLVDICDTTVVSVRPPDCSLRIVLLDTGITVTLSDNDKRVFRKVFKAIALGEGEKVGQLFLEHCRKEECNDKDKFVKEMAEIVTVARQQTIKLGKIQVADLLTNVFSTLSRHKVKLEANFASVILAIMVLEGLGRSLDPEIDLMDKAKPVLLKGS